MPASRSAPDADRDSAPTDRARRKLIASTVRAAVVIAMPALAAHPAAAQQPGAPSSAARLPSLGVLTFGATPTAKSVVERALREGLRERGWIEGRDLAIEPRFADGSPERLNAMAAELVRLPVDVILAGGQPAREAARAATRTIPIVTISGSDPVREGWAASLARPGGNVTGLTFAFPEIEPKRLELARELLPGLTRVAVLVDRRELVDAADIVAELKAAAPRLGITLQLIEARGAGDFEAAFAQARQRAAQAVVTIALLEHRARLVELAKRERLPLIGESSLEAEAGYLLTYGADLDALIRRAMAYVEKLLKGARAAELPIERPTTFRLTVNLPAARALGIAVPQALLLRADQVLS
jgi:putative ABC transport system substrate-binding protein